MNMGMDGLAATERTEELRDRCGDMPGLAATAFDTCGQGLPQRC